jgi:hypothetical protein
MRRPFVLQVAAMFLALAAVSTTSAIIIRHDRDESLSIALGARYPAVGNLQGEVTCTLIAPRWALTAAHTIENHPPFTDLYVLFDGERYEVEKAIIHPGRVRDAVDSSADLALLKLDRPVRGITPVLLYDRDDEVDKQVILVGYGHTGTGLTGPVGEKSKVRRGATNRIDADFENSLMMLFDAPPGGTELEGIGGGGDSGSPALLEEGGKLYTVGVSSFNSGVAGTSGRYWTFEGYARVSTRRKWIMDTIAADPPTSLWSPLKKLGGKVALPQTVAGRRAAAFFAVWNTGKEAMIAKFYAEHRTPDPKGRSAAERVKGWQELLDTYGHYQPYGFAQEGPNRFAVLVRAERNTPWRGILFELEKEKPHRVKSMQMGDVEAPKVGGRASPGRAGN